MNNTNNVVDYNKFVECQEYLRKNYPSDICVPGIAFCRELMHKTIDNDDEIPKSFVISNFYSNSHEAIEIVLWRLTDNAVQSVNFCAYGKKSDFILCKWFPFKQD